MIKNYTLVPIIYLFCHLTETWSIKLEKQDILFLKIPNGIYLFFSRKFKNLDQYKERAQRFIEKANVVLKECDAKTKFEKSVYKKITGIALYFSTKIPD